MPVRTRSQRLREEKGESAVNVSQSAPRRTTRKQRSSKRSRKVQKQQEFEEINNSNHEMEEMKSEEVYDDQQKPMSMPQMTPRDDVNKEQKEEEEHDFNVDDDDEIDSNLSFNSNTHVDELRKYVKTILDTPDKHDVETSEVDMDELRRQDQLRRQQQVVPSPRIDRITIKNQRNVMEFLIPPKQQDEPMEIRRQIQEALSPNNKPKTSALLDDIPRDKSKSPSKSPYNSANPKYHENTHLWSPNVPGFDEKNADRITRMLVIMLLTILVAVIVAYYQDAWIEFIKKTFPSMIEAVQGFMEAIKQMFTWNIQSNIESVSNDSPQDEEPSVNIDADASSDADPAITRG